MKKAVAGKIEPPNHADRIRLARLYVNKAARQALVFERYDLAKALAEVAQTLAAAEPIMVSLTTVS